MNDQMTLFYNFAVIFISSLFTYLGLDTEAIGLFCLLLIIDYMTGLLKAYRLEISITSNKMKYGLFSKLSLLIIPLSIGIGAKAIGIDLSSIIYTTISILVLSEVYSIISNIHAIRTKEELPEYDATRIIARKIRDYLLKLETK